MNPSFLTPNNPTSKFTFTKFIEGTSKTLTFINKAIPVYNNAKPLINNTKTLVKGIINSNKTKPINTVKTSENKDSFIKKEEIKKERSSSLTFFQ